MKKGLLLPMIILLATFQYGIAQEEHNCFTVMVGKKASLTGSVLMAHNEDDYGKQLVNWYAVPRISNHEGTERVLKNGGRVGLPAFLNRYIWLEIPGMDFSDSYLNEYGVCIASNSCSSREDKPDLTDGGIGYNLRQILAERATSAKEAVVIAGQLIERFGYTGSGRTYCLADPHEAWALAVVKGKHWVARRVPDNQVMVIPNNYTITEVDLNDPVNYLGCSDLISYATERGWYNPETDGAFNFRKAYAAKNSITHPGNANRAWGAYYLFDAGYSLSDDFPFSFSPKTPVTKEFLMGLLRSHYEGTPLDKSEGFAKGSPYQLNGSMICGKASVYGFVADLRSWMPVDIGCMIWLAPQWPDIQPFIPLYAGVTDFPDQYRKKGYLNTIDDHYNPPQDIHVRDSHHAFWAFVEFSEKMDAHYGKNIGWVRSKNLRLEKALLDKQPGIEKKLETLYGKDPDKARKAVTMLYGDLAKIALKQTRKSIKSIKE